MASKSVSLSESGKVRRVAVVGGGLAGLMTTIKLCEAGVPVHLFSLVPVKRSHSVCAQGGINASVNTKGEGDSPQVHLEETVYGGDFLANQPPVKGMADAAPGIVFMLDRMGVPFNRTPEGLLDFRKFEFFDFLSVVRDDHGIARGIVAQDTKTMEIDAFPGEAVCLATGGSGI